MPSFKRDATGYIVVNLSRGPSMNPILHDNLSVAEAEARRLSDVEVGDTIQVFQVVPSLGVFRKEERKTYHYVFETEGCVYPILSTKDFISPVEARQHASHCGRKILSVFSTSTTVRVDR
jgi:hypothetical protein